MGEGFALDGVALFAGMPPEDLARMETGLTVRRVSPGTAICRRGDAAGSLFVVAHGLVDVFVPGDGQVSRLRRGDIFGELGMLTGQVRTADAVAATAAAIVEIDGSAYQDLAARYPILSHNMVGILSDRLARRNTFAASGGRSDIVAMIHGRSGSEMARAATDAALKASPGSVAVNAPSHDDLRGDFGRSLDELSVSHDLVLVLADLEEAAPLSWLKEVNRILLIGDSTDEDKLSATLREDDPRVELAAISGGHHQHRFTMIRSMTSPRDLAWLGRHVARKKIGLALGAGGAKGYAHVGALEVLHEAGFSIDAVAGSSIGAWVAACFAFGMDPGAIAEAFGYFFSERNVDAMFRRGSSGDPSGQSVMAEVTRDVFGEISFSELPIPLVVMTADLAGQRPVAISTGRVRDALCTAIRVPGLYPPLLMGDQRLVDAVILSPVPVRGVVKAGADVTVAINLMNRRTLAAWPGPPLPPVTRPGVDPVRDTMLEAMELSQLDASSREADGADITLCPRFGPGTWRHFHLAPYYREAGSAECREKIPDLKRLV